ncbi:hypothetical protein [Cognatishimia activa]|uniref:hypothetical protein n=1 Tax=Cognatishimia activa TaxID=1715691 RepID=UPI00222E24E3|nr:hypothetical protein [Cognatishimia activa]UZD89873.1 hypothetical protein M0D42_09745 [Cognatishimia activa]
MHKWFTQKINEMIGLAHYCQYPILKAHLILTQQAIDETYGQSSSDSSSLKRILPLLIKQAELDGNPESARHMRRALEAMESDSILAENVVQVSFVGEEEKRSQLSR